MFQVELTSCDAVAAALIGFFGYFQGSYCGHVKTTAWIPTHLVLEAHISTRSYPAYRLTRGCFALLCFVSLLGSSVMCFDFVGVDLLYLAQVIQLVAAASELKLSRA